MEGEVNFWKTEEPESSSKFAGGGIDMICDIIFENIAHKHNYVNIFREAVFCVSLKSVRKQNRIAPFRLS